MFPTGEFNMYPMDLPFGYQQLPTSFLLEQFGNNAFNSQDRTQFYQFAQLRGQSLPPFIKPYPQASGSYIPGQLPSSSSRLQQYQQGPLPGFSQYYDNYSSQNQLPGYQYGLSQFQRPSNTFQPFSPDGRSQDKGSHRRSKQDDTQSRSPQQTLVIVELNANTGQALKEPPKKYRHREHRTDSGINSQKAASGPISSSVQPSTVIRETTGRKQSPQPSRSTSCDPSHSNGSQAATTDTTAKRQQNQREETAAQLAHTAAAHANNRQAAGGGGSDVQHQVPAATPQSVLPIIRPQVIPQQQQQQHQQGIQPSQQIHGSMPETISRSVDPYYQQHYNIGPQQQQQSQREGTTAQLAHAAATHANNRQVAGGGGDSDVQHQVLAAASPSEEIDRILPTKVFDGQKKSVNDLNQAASSYVWFRRIKEIFLVMGDENDAFSCSEMGLARNDMIETCDQYLESLRPKVRGANL
ncbi:unnamed protein product, partial [Rotaria sordida]